MEGYGGEMGRTFRNAEDGASPLTWGAILVGACSSECGIESFWKVWISCVPDLCSIALCCRRGRMCLCLA